VVDDAIAVSGSFSTCRDFFSKPIIMAFPQADQSPWDILANATLIFRRVTAYSVDPSTGNEVPSAWQELEGRAYFSEAALYSEEGKGIPIGSYKVKGYTVGILPDWANEPIDQRVECTVDHLGKGYFYHQGSISVVRDQVEEAGVGTPIQGYFTRQGS
jgi:hypothetical protein